MTANTPVRISFVGRGFSRDINEAVNTRALAPEVCNTLSELMAKLRFLTLASEEEELFRFAQKQQLN
jgi:hypothetical protein